MDTNNESPGSASAPATGYQVIYADPPWRYGFSKSNSRAIEAKYPTMTTAEICALSVPSATDSVLYLWAVAPKIGEALEVMKAWGFEYKSCAVWDKELPGMGYWFRGQHELLMVGVRGKVSPPLPSLRVSSVMRYRRGRHSAKPPQIRQMIDDWFPSKTKLEMFAREKPEGWHVFGNEVPCDVRLTDNLIQ